MRKADPYLIAIFMNGLWRPRKTNILGMEFAGTVESVGRAVTRFAEGDQVFGSTGFKFGAHAEYVRVPQDGTLATKPVNMTLEEAAAVSFGGLSALHFLRKAKVRAGQRLLVHGASGSVGVFAVQLAKHFGAHVTGVCSTANLDLVRSLGADEVVDYTREDFSRAGRVYDVVFERDTRKDMWSYSSTRRAGGRPTATREVESAKRIPSRMQAAGPFVAAADRHGVRRTLGLATWRSHAMCS